jgi:hypothetical protein
LLKALPGIPFSVALTQQDPWLREVPSAGKSLEILPYIDTAWVVVDTDFDSYWNARGKNLRQNVKRQLAKLAAEGTAAELEVLETEADIADAIEDYGRLESAGWKSEGGTAVGADNPQGRFYQTVFARMCRDGLGRIYRFRLADRVAAMDLCVEQGDVMVILKTAYDESFKSVSPASLMRYEYFRRIFEMRRVRRIEFYGRLMEWHTRWTVEKRTLYHVNRFRWPWLRSARKAWRFRGAS